MRTLLHRLAGLILGVGLLAGSFVTLAPTAEAAATPCVDQVFNYSLTTKTCVTYIQKMKNSIYSNSAYPLKPRTVSVDGKYGTQTQSAITDLQAHAWIQKTNLKFYAVGVDGTTGTQTWWILCTFSKVSTTAAGCKDSNFPSDYLGAELHLEKHS